MCHMFPCVMEKSAFPIRDAPIDKRNLFLLSGRAVSHCRHKSLQKSWFQLIEKKISNSNYLRKQTLNSRNAQIKICKVQLISLYILQLSIFSCQLLCNSCFFFFIISLFALNSIFLLQLSSSFTFT